MNISSTESTLFLKKIINEKCKIDCKKLKQNEDLTRALFDLESKKNLKFESKNEELDFG